MQVLQVFNQTRSLFGGEEVVLNLTRQVLERNGHTTSLMTRSCRGSDRDLFSKAKIALTGIYNPLAYFEMQQTIKQEQPDVVHVHGVYPNLSPSIFAACRAMSVPVVLHVHNHVLTCPSATHLRNGDACDLCFGGREQWCLLTNCRGSLAESAAYMARSFVGRKFGLFERNVTLFIAVSKFLKDRLVAAGYSADQIEIVPNAVCSDSRTRRTPPDLGEYIGFAGRLTYEKGLGDLIQAAKRTNLPVRVAGDGPLMEQLRHNSPDNVHFVGRLQRDQMAEFYARSRFVVVPSRFNETFCLVAAEAMIQGKPVIANRLGALPDLIENGVRGFLINTQDAEKLSQGMRLLWDDERLCRRLGANAQAWAIEHCSDDLYCRRLVAVYERALTMTHRVDAPMISQES